MTRWLAFGVLVLILVGTAMPTWACNRVQVRGASYHYDRSKDYEEFNPGLGCEWRSRDERWFTAVGVFNNSFGESTADVLVGWLPLHPLPRVRLGLTTGAFYGYDEKFVPMPPVPTVRVERVFHRDVDLYAVLTSEVAMFFASVKF